MHRAKIRKQYRSFVRLALFLDGRNDSDGVDGSTASNGGTSSGECRAALEEVRLAYRLGMKKGTDSLSKSMAFSEVSRRTCLVGWKLTLWTPPRIQLFVHRNLSPDFTLLTLPYYRDFQGERRLKELRSMVGFVPTKRLTQQRDETASAAGDDSYDPDSWINIKDDEDPRGRVGVQWPWERENGSK